MRVSVEMTMKPTSSGRRLDGEELLVLIQAAASGRSDAWDRLVEEFGGLVWAIARSYRLSDADASDVAQTTWLLLLEHLDDLKDPARVGAWLATTTRRECQRVLRGRGRELCCGDDLPEPASLDPELVAQLLVEERDTLLWRAFGRLRDSDQALLRVLMAEPAPSYEEISAALDLPIGSIGPTRARALGRLRRELQHDGSLALLAG